MAWKTDPGGKVQWHDRAWVRAEMAEWDERFARLSPEARRTFVEDIRAAARADTAPPKTPAARLPAAPLEELVKAGLVEVLSGPRGGEQVIVPQPVFGFATRLRALARYRLLRDAGTQALRNYVSHAYDSYSVRHHLAEVTDKAIGRQTLYMSGDPLDTFVPLAAWPDWVADWLGTPLARRVLDAIEQAGGQLPITEVAARVKGASPAEVRATIDQLVIYLALAEDLHPTTYAVEVGLLPEVREARGRRTAAPPAMPEAQAPTELVPEGGIEVPDLRAVLLEAAGDPPRVRQDRAVFAKEMPRFTSALPPLPPALFDPSHTLDARVDLVIERALRLKFVKEQRQGKETRLVLTERGRRWLASETEAQYEAVYAFLRDPPQDFYPGEGDNLFLGSNVFACATKKGGREEPYYFPFPRDPKPLREAAYRAWARVPVGQFYPLADLLRYLVQSGNPVLLGLPPAQVRVWVGGRPLVPVPELLEEAGEKLLADMVMTRLISLGAVQFGWSASGEGLLARLPRLDPYFGKPPTVAGPAREQMPTRVIVQPDFSVMVIGPSPEPAAALAPFSERVQGHAGGAITFRLTRESVVRGLSLGLSTQELLARLEKHASTGVPANVRKQVESWAGRVRTVSVSTIDLVRCPDAETAQRLQSALGKNATRLADTLVGLPAGSLKGAVREKLRNEGLLVEKTEKN